MSRSATISRATSETDVTVTLALDGSGRSDVSTGIGFLDHMLTGFARHALFDLEVAAEGDLHVDDHHTTEDVGIALGMALARALGDKRGIARFGHAVVPMDDALVEAAIDLSGRAYFAWSVPFARDKVGEMDSELFEEFFRALSSHGQFNLHLIARAGRNTHHLAEACFKATARALRQSVTMDARIEGVIPSTKGAL